MKTMMQDLDEALATCETLLESPAEISWTEACQTVGNILTSMGFIVESYPWRSMAFDASPNSAKFYAESGRIYSQCEVWDRALYFCQRTLEQQPDNTDVRRHLAKIYNQLGDYRSETKILNELLALRPDQATAEGHLKLGRVMQSQGQPQQAQISFQRALEQDSHCSAAYYALGDLLLQQGKPDQAIQLFTQHVEQLPPDDPEKAMAHYRLGRAYRQAQQFEQAVIHFRTALELDDHLHWAYMGLMNVLMQLKRWDEVVKTCSGIIQSVEAFPWAYSFMGNALANKGDFPQAAVSHQQAFALRGWQRCAERGYEFTHTWFGENIPLWESHLAVFNEPGSLRDPIHLLSLGSSDASSLCWLADKVLQQPGDKLTCITPDVSPALRSNVAKLTQSAPDSSDQLDLSHLDPSGSDPSSPDSSSHKVTFALGDLQAQLSALAAALASTPEKDPSQAVSQAEFEIVYIQSDHKQGDYLKALATQSWPLLKPTGLMIVKDYQWRHPTLPDQSSAVGIDAFIASVAAEVEILHQSHQIILRKVIAFHDPS